MAEVPPIEVRLQLQIDDLKRQIRDVVGEFDKLKQAQEGGATAGAEAVAKQIAAYQVLGQVATRVFSSIAGAAGDVLGATAEFSRQITTVGAINVTSSEKSLAALSDEAVRLGTVTSKSPQQVAAAGVSLSRLGFTANQVNQNLSGLVLAAEATQGSVESAADVVGASVKIFGDFEKAPITAAKSADIFAATLNNTGVGSLDEFNQLLSKAGATGKATGQDLVTLSVAFGSLRSAGFSAEVAGTALKTVLNSLSAPSTEAAAALNQLGVNTRDSATGEMKNLLDLLPEINDALANVAPAERDAITQAIFGARGGPAALTLMGQSRESLNQLRATIDQNGVASDTAGKLIDKGLSGGLVLLTSSVETATLAIGQSLEPALDFVVRRGVDLINIFLAIPGPLKALGAAAVVVAGGIAGLTAAATAYLVVQQSGTIALVKEGAVLVATTAKKALYLAVTGGTATAAAAATAAQNLSVAAMIKEGVVTGIATVNKFLFTTSVGAATGAIGAQVGALIASVKGLYSQATASLAAAGGMGKLALATLTALAPLAALAAATVVFTQVWKSATVGLEAEGAFKDAAKSVDEVNAALGKTEASQTAAARAAGSATEAYGHQVGILNVNNRTQLANQRSQKGLTKLIEATSTTMDASVDLIAQYGLTQVDAGDKARLGAKGTQEFADAALKQKEAIETSIGALEAQRDAATTDEQEQQINAQIAALQKNKAALNDRLNALGVQQQTEQEVTDTVAAMEEALNQASAAYGRQTAAIDLATAAKRANIAESQVTGTIDEGEAAAQSAALEQDALDQRLAANQKYQAELRALVEQSGAGTTAGQMAAQKLVEAETESQELRTQIAESQIAERQRLEEQALTAIDAASEQRLAQIEMAAGAETEAIKRALVEGKISREEAAAQEAELALKSGEERLNAIYAEQNALANALNSGTISREEFERRSTELAKEAQDQRIEQLDNELKTKEAKEEAELKAKEEREKAALDKAKAERQKADSEIEASAARRELAIQQAIAAGTLSEEEAAAQSAQNAREQAAQRTTLAEQELATLEDLRSQGLVSEEEYAQRKIDLGIEVTKAQTDAVKAAIAEQETVQRAAIANIEKTSQRAIATLQNQAAALSQQNSLLDAQTGILDALSNLSKTRASIAASLAGSELERAQIEQKAAEEAQIALAGKQAQELKILEIKQRQAALEAEIATRTAEANLAKARAAGATQEEIAALQELVSLQRANEAAIAQSGELQRQATEINQQAAREQAAADVELARRATQEQRVAAEDEAIKLQRESAAIGKEPTDADRAKQVQEDIKRTQQLAKTGAITQGQAAERLRGLDAGEDPTLQEDLNAALQAALKSSSQPTAQISPTAPPALTEPTGINDLKDAVDRLNQNLQRPNINVESVSPVEDVLELQRRR